MLHRQPADDADPVQHRHPQIEQDRVRLVLGHQLQRLLAIGGRPDHVDIGQPAEQQDQALAHAGLVISDNHAQRRTPRPAGSTRASGSTRSTRSTRARRTSRAHDATLRTPGRGSSAVTTH
jgi:hypothetical protein